MNRSALQEVTISYFTNISAVKGEHYAHKVLELASTISVAKMLGDLATDQHPEIAEMLQQSISKMLVALVEHHSILLNAPFGEVLDQAHSIYEALSRAADSPEEPLQ
jgi:hypothetical protein